MVSNLPPLVADGGELRLARRVAALVYGRREVAWPQDVADPEDDLPDGREFGWVAKLDGPEPGLSERRFVRADVSIDAVEKISDVEHVLDDTALRAGGDVYFESLIEGKGLGLLKPGVDFDEGDLVDVRFWGRILKDQLVTSIDWDGDDPSVKLGGQSIRDTDSLARARAESLRLIRRERAERKDDVRAVDSKATQAKDTAESATGALAGPGASPDDVTQGMSELAQQMQTNDEQAPVGLIDAYMQANDERWRMQVEINEATDAALIAHGAAIEANEKAIKSLMRGVAGFMHVPTDAGSWSDDRIEVTRSGGTVAVTALDRWRGTVAFSGSHTGQDGVVTPVIRGSTVPYSGGREYSFPSSGQSIVHYLVNPGVVEDREIANLPVQTLANREWVTVLAWDVPEDTDLMVVAKWVWVAKTYGGDYWGRIVVNGVDVTDAFTSASAPLFGHGRRVAQVSTQWVEAKSGDVVEVQAQAGHGNSTNRRVDSVRANITTVTDEA